MHIPLQAENMANNNLEHVLEEDILELQMDDNEVRSEEFVTFY